jgi:hypothetical protein
VLWDLWVDYHRTDGDGLTHTRLEDLERPLDLRPGMFVIVGNEEADPAVAEVAVVEPDGLVLVRVLHGPELRGRGRGIEFQDPVLP